ncbi:hypothetical protein Tco_0969325 [Tanacetum coccineum]
MPRKKFNVLAQHLQEIMEDSLPIMVDDRVKELTMTQVLDDPHDDAHPEGENSSKRQKTSEIDPLYSYATHDDEISTEKVSQELVNEMLQTVDEEKLRKEIRKDILVSPHPQKPTLVVQSCQRDPEAPALSLVNQDLLYLKKGNAGPKKIVLSLYKFHVVILPDDDIEERTSIWVEKCIKKFNPYAQYSVEHWKNHDVL